MLGIPFDFAAAPVVAPPTAPKKTVRVQAMRERAALEIHFPRVEGYRVDLPDERITAQFTEDSRFQIDPSNVGPCKVFMQGIVGEGVELNADVLESVRPSAIAYRLSKLLLETRFRDPGEDLPVHLFGNVQRVVRQWIEGGYLVAKGVPLAAVGYQELAEQACELIYLACQRGIRGEKRIKAILDSYNPRGSTRFVAFNTSKDVWETDAERCHVNFGVLDSDWEAELARVVEGHPRVRAYVKNQGLGFEVPYRDGSVPRRYVPDFIVELDDGPEPLHLVLETKGFRGVDAQIKAETMKALWVPGVNNLGTQGRWAFAEFRDAFAIEEAFGRLVDGLLRVEEMA